MLNPFLVRMCSPAKKNNVRFTNPMQACHTCHKSFTKLLLCSRCREVHYCSKDCQTEDWPRHKTHCKPSISTNQKQDHMNVGHSDRNKNTQQDDTNVEKVYQMGPAPGKGLGMFATKDVKAGERVLSEKSLFCIANDFSALSKFVGTGPDDTTSKLSQSDRIIFWDLRDSHCSGDDDKTAIGICQTNGLPLGKGTTAGGIFPLCSRINHSCCPNINHSWNPNTERENIYAIRDIQQGEEILTCYVDDFYLMRDERRQRLKQTFNFVCECPLCSASEHERKESDERRKQMKKLDDEIYSCVSMMRTTQALKKVQILLRKQDEESILHKAATYYDAFQACCVAKNEAGAKKWAKLAYENYILTEGEDSPNTRKMWNYHQNPRLHNNWSC